jgi:CMP/dCMP kinase
VADPAPVIVAIDGPSGAGKSTVARLVARGLGLPYIDTGAMYRAVGLLARRTGIPLPVAEPERVADLARGCRIDLAPSADGSRVLLDGEDVSSAIREPAISMYASAVSAIPEVRRCLVAQQQRLGRSRGGVLEGRDIGTRVFPDTPYKFFLTASAEIRADRRTRELAGRGTPGRYEEVLEELLQRDHDDSTRQDSPLTCDDRYRVIDTGNRTAEEVSGLIAEAVRRAREAGRPTP